MTFAQHLARECDVDIGIEVLETLFPIFGLPETSVRVVVILVAIGFVPAMVLCSRSRT